MLLATTPVYSAESFGPINFVSWAAQGPVDSNNIRAIYASFAASDTKNVGKFLRNITLSKDRGEFMLVMCLETKGGRPVHRIMPLHGLGVGPCFGGEDSKVPVYVWDLEKCSGQAPLYILVELTRNLKMEERFNINKVDVVDITIGDEGPEEERVALDVGSAMDKVQVTGPVYIISCLTPALLTGVRLQPATWGIIQDCAKKL